MSSRVRLRSAYNHIRAYDSEPVACDLHLADNTSPFGPPPTALHAARDAATGQIARYPSTYSRALREAIATYVGVAADEVLVAAGSDEVLSCSFRALAEPGSRVAIMHPTFVMARVFAETNSLCPVPVPLTPSLDADAEALLATEAELTYLCTPNNPTGTPVSTAALDRVLASARGVVMIDEAYAEYAGTNLAHTAPSRDGMLVLRTFSKAFGLAGLRVGYAIGARALIAELEKARGPYAVTMISEQAALAAVQHDVPWVVARAAEVCAVRDWFSGMLHGAGYKPLPSRANFVLLPVADSDAAARCLLARGILVRQFPALAGVGDALRISIATRHDMERVLRALMECAPCA